MSRDGELKISGEDAEKVLYATKTIEGLLKLASRGETVTEQNVRYVLNLVKAGHEDKVGQFSSDVLCVTATGKPSKAKTQGHKRDVDAHRKTLVR